ncbi:hypothetical protein Bca4012_019816 [Brassica carinata]
MVKEHKEELSKNDKLLIEEFTARMSQVFNDKFGKLRQDIQQLRKSRTSRDEYKQRGYDQFERNQKHDVDIKETSQQRRFERDKWSTDRNQPSETKLYPSISFQKPHDSKKPRTSTGVVSTSKTPTCFRKEKTVHKPSIDDKHSWFSEEDKKELLQVMQNVRNQLNRTNTTLPSIDTQHREPVTAVSELKDAEPDSTASIQEDQPKVTSPIFHKDEQPVQNVIIPFKQVMVAEETPRGPQTAHRMGQLIVFDQCDFQKTFFGTFLISSFVWNKTRAVDLSRNDLGLKNVIFEPGGNFFNHRDKITMIEKNSTVAIFDFGYLLSSEDNVLHVSAQQEFHYETNWRMLPTLSWIQQTRQRGKWPPDHQVIANLAKHVGLDNFQETFISYSVGRLQTYSWIPGAYVNILIILGEYSARARISWGHKKLEAEQHALILNNIKIWKPPFIQQLQCHCGEYKTMIGDEEVTGEIGEVITGSGKELMFSSQIKEKPPDKLSLQQSPKKPTRGIYLNSEKNMKPDLLAIGTGQTVLRSTLFEKKDSSYEPTCPTFLVLSISTRNQFEAETNSELQVTDSATQVDLHFLHSELAEFRTSQSYIWQPGEKSKVSNSVFNDPFVTDYIDMMHLFLSKEPCADYKEALKHKRTRNKCEEDKRFKPPDLNQERHPNVTCFIVIKEVTPDATSKSKPIKNRFGLFLLLYDNCSCANLLYDEVYEP